MDQTMNRELSRKEDGEVICVVCRLVCMQIFQIRPNVYLFSCVLVDQDGVAFDVKTYNRNKAFYVVNHFKQDDELILNCRREAVTETDIRFTQSKYEMWSTEYDWYLEFFDGQFKSLSIAATFLGMSSKGPIRYDSGSSTKLAEGRFARFSDDDGLVFGVLVWKRITTNKDYRFSLESCKPGDCVLLPNVRMISEYHRDRSSIYKLTTIYPPVVKSKSISPRAYQALYH